MASNASHMLEAALEQMDDIITGKGFWFIVVFSRLATLSSKESDFGKRENIQSKEREREYAEHVRFFFVIF